MIDGLVVVDKPAAMTSHDVVARCRTIFGQRRVGHAGTLDPDATGILLVGLGKATRLLRFIGSGDKTYTADIVFGAETTTQDSSGEVVTTFAMAGLTRSDVAAAASGLTGEILQIPPMYSARHHGGVRLHELARRGEVVERIPSPVTVHRFDVLGPVGDRDTGPVFSVEVECSTGTYIRTLAHDLGRALGGGAYVSNLRRTVSGGFGVSDAVPLESVGTGAVLSMPDALRSFPRFTLTAAETDRVRHGGRVAHDRLPARQGGVWCAMDSEGTVVAIFDVPPPDPATDSPYAACASAAGAHSGGTPGVSPTVVLDAAG